MRRIAATASAGTVGARPAGKNSRKGESQPAGPTPTSMGRRRHKHWGRRSSPRTPPTARPRANRRARLGVDASTKIAAKSVMVKTIAAHPRAKSSKALLTTRSVMICPSNQPAHRATNHRGSGKRSRALHSQGSIATISTSLTIKSANDHDLHGGHGRHDECPGIKARDWYQSDGWCRCGPRAVRRHRPSEDPAHGAKSSVTKLPIIVPSRSSRRSSRGMYRAAGMISRATIATTEPTATPATPISDAR